MSERRDPLTPWWHHAECKTEDPALFEEPERGERGSALAARIQLAKQVCARCIVREECLAETMTIPVSEDWGGVRGGLTTRERRKLRRRSAA